MKNTAASTTTEAATSINPSECHGPESAAAATGMKATCNLDGLSIIDEATQLLDVGARIAKRLDEIQVTEMLARQYAPDAFVTPRQRAMKMRRRMTEFRSIYNAAWMVRNYQHSSGEPLEKAISTFCVVLTQELEKATDKEALLYAVADSLTLSPYGVPWQS